jgi:uncharacterized membrane protein
MGFVWTIAGAIIGIFLGAEIANDSTAILGLLSGAAIGLLYSRLRALAARTEQVEIKLARFQAFGTSGESAPDLAVAPALSSIVDPLAPPSLAMPPNADSGLLDLSAVPSAPASPSPSPTPQWTAPTASAPNFPSEPEAPRADFLDKAIGAIKRWFTEGNVPVKVGMLVLFAGVAALLKYAADEGWFTLPIEFRLAGIAVAAIAALGFGWRQREQRRSFALSLQGGAIGLLLLTVFAAFRLYQLLPAGGAFGLMLVLVAGVGVLAVLQDALALAVLGILAGFVAPILISTGSGNHVVLFSYYALLNAAIFAIAWVRPWRALNLLGFFFTYAIGTGWGVLSYKPELFASTEPFLLLFFAFYLAIPILYAFKRAPQRRDAIDGTLIFGNPLIAFGLQAVLLDGERMPLALSALALGVIYMLLARLLIRRARVLGESFAVLALGFSTLAIPLALSARTTACIFALEGAALVWLGLRQGRRLPQWIGLGLQLLAAGAFVIAFDTRGVDALPFANGPFVGALLIAASALVTAWLYLRANALPGRSVPLYLWGLLWWLAAMLFEIERFVPVGSQSTAVLGLLALTAWLAAEAERRLHRQALAWTVAIMLGLTVPLGFVIAADGQPFAGWSLAAYVAYALLGWRSLICLGESENQPVAFAHIGWLWTWTVAFALSLLDLAHAAELGQGWWFALAWLPLLAIHAFTLRRPRWISPPLSAGFVRYRAALLGTQALAIGLLFIASLVHAGASSPLPFVPIFNPLELAQLAALIGFLLWTRDTEAPDVIRSKRPILLAAAGFAFVTAATLRAVHHLGGIGWDEGIISANLSQTSLAVVWSVLGVAGWVIGSRRGSRPLWLAGALLMAIVLVKLLLIDRQHLGNLFGIASFIAYGLLCTLIGYLAPAPPRKAVEGEAA